MTRYEIVIRGLLGPALATYFDGFEVVESAGGAGPPSTVLSGAVPDQSALHGLLARIRDLGLELEVVRRLPAE